MVYHSLKEEVLGILIKEGACSREEIAGKLKEKPNRAILMGYFMGKAKFSSNKTTLNLFGLLAATLFHGAYDFFLFIDFVPGIATGAFISLAIGIFLSNKAIKKHTSEEHII